MMHRLNIQQHGASPAGGRHIEMLALASKTLVAVTMDMCQNRRRLEKFTQGMTADLRVKMSPRRAQAAR
jgi:hypothetical protein